MRISLFANYGMVGFFLTFCLGCWGAADESEVSAGLGMEVSLVKREFGPGESILLRCYITNDHKKEARTIRLDNQAARLRFFAFEIKKDGKPVEALRLSEMARMRIPELEVTIPPCTRHAVWIDLQAIDWKDPAWMKAAGTYDLAVLFKGISASEKTPLRSDWLRFQITSAGTSRPRPRDPKVQQRVTELIAQLGAEEFWKREDAEKELLKIGREALGMIQEALDSAADAEIKLRCKKLCQRIRDQADGENRPTGLCRACVGKAFTADVGQCHSCRGATPSGGWSFCGSCAIRRGLCAACGRTLTDHSEEITPKPPVSILPDPRPILRRPQPAPKPRPKPEPVKPPVWDEEF